MKKNIYLILIILITISCNNNSEKRNDVKNLKTSIQKYMKHDLGDSSNYEPVNFDTLKNSYIISHKYRAINSYGLYGTDYKFFTFDSNFNIVNVNSYDEQLKLDLEGWIKEMNI